MSCGTSSAAENRCHLHSVRTPGEVRDSPGAASQLEDVHAGICAIDDVDVAAIVDLDVVRLDRNLAALVAALPDAATVGIFCRRRDVIADLLDVERIANVQRTHTGVEEGDEEHPTVVDGRETFLRGMRAKTAAAAAEVAACFRHSPGRDADWRRLERDVDHPYHLPRLLTFVRQRFTHDGDEVSVRLSGRDRNGIAMLVTTASLR